MKSIFNLIENKEDIPSSNYGSGDLQYQEITSRRPLADTDAQNNFSNAIIEYRWTLPSDVWWIPSRSFLKLDYVIKSSAADTQIEEKFQVAPAMGLAHNLFQQMDYRISEKVINAISSNYPQIAALRTRLKRSGDWLNTMGDTINHWKAKYQDRLAAFAQNGTEKVIWRQGNKEVIDVVAAADNYKGAQLWFLDEANNQYSTTGADSNLTFIQNGGTAIPDLSKFISIGDRVHIRLGGVSETHVVSNYSSSGSDFNNILVMVGVPGVQAPQLVTHPNIRLDRPVARVQCASRRVKQSEIFFQPALPIFDVTHAIPGMAALQELNLLPYNDGTYQKNAIESCQNLIPGTNYEFQVKDLKLYLATIRGPRVLSKSFYLDFDEINCQVQNLTTATSTQHTISVSPSTNAISIALQQQNAIGDTRYSLSKFKVQGDHEENLSEIYLRYAGIQRPQPRYQLDLNLAAGANKTDQINEPYMRTMLYNGAIFDSSVESWEEFRDRGMYIYVPFTKQSSDRSTVCYVKTAFNTANAKGDFDITKISLLVFSHHKKLVLLRVIDGSVSEIFQNDA